MLKTIVRPSRDLRNKYREVVNSLEQYDHIIITNNGVGEAVLINMDVFAMFEQFLHNQFIYDELQKSKGIMNDASTKKHGADEVHAELEQILEAQGL